MTENNNIDPIADSLQPATGYSTMPPHGLQHVTHDMWVEMATRERWDAECEQCAAERAA